MDSSKVATNNRLTIIGNRQQVRLFQGSDWNRRLAARFIELLENSPRRFVVIFMTEAPPLRPLTRLSMRWPSLVLLLDYEVQTERVKGLAKAKAGQLQHYKVDY